MKLRQVIFAAIIGCMPCVAALSQQSTKRTHEWSRPRPSPIMVKADTATPIEFVASPESVYCSSTGKRIIPVRTAHDEVGHEKKLQRPRREVLPISDSGKNARVIVIEYCEKTETKQAIQYKSAILEHDETSMFADELVFDHQKQILEGRGRVDVIQHGQRLEAKPYVLLNLKDGQFHLDYTNGAIASVRGKGEIKSGKASFDFFIDMNKVERNGGVVRFEFEDQARGVKLVSRKRDCLFIKTTADGVVTFGGSAKVIGAQHLHKANHKDLVYFTVTVKDGRKNNNNDHFSINIPKLVYRQDWSPVTDGDIEVNALSRNTTPPIKAAPFQ